MLDIEVSDYIGYLKDGRIKTIKVGENGVQLKRDAEWEAEIMLDMAGQRWICGLARDVVSPLRAAEIVAHQFRSYELNHIRNRIDVPECGLLKPGLIYEDDSGALNYSASREIIVTENPLHPKVTTGGAETKRALTHYGR